MMMMMMKIDAIFMLRHH